MLIINTKVGQSVLVGKEVKVTVDGIHMDSKSITVTVHNIGYKKTGKMKQHTIGVKLGNTIPLIQRVLMTPTFIFENGSTKVSLGFEAPKSVGIRGEWFRPKIVDVPVQINSLDNVRLSVQANRIARTQLERALVNRLDELMSVLEANNIDINTRRK